MVGTLRDELHSPIKALIDEGLEEGTPRPFQVSVHTARTLVEDAIDDLVESYGREEVGSVRDLEISGPNGPVPLRVYRPSEPAGFPVLVWYHGGGWVRSSIEAADALCRRFVNELGFGVVSVGYRLAPEHPFPAGLLDCFAATRWAHRNTRITGGDGDGLVIGGPSAGGNIAAAVSLLAADRGFAGISYQVLGVPVTDRSFDTTSYEENATGYGLTRPDMQYYWDHYLDRDVDAVNPYAAPLRRHELSGLPPAMVVTAGFDPLRDEGIAYADRLRSADVPTDHLHYPGMPHGIFNPKYLLSGIDPAVDAIEEICATIADAVA